MAPGTVRDGKEKLWLGSGKKQYLALSRGRKVGSDLIGSDSKKNE